MNDIVLILLRSILNLEDAIFTVWREERLLTPYDFKFVLLS
jgi:hypothetical protein